MTQRINKEKEAATRLRHISKANTRRIPQSAMDIARIRLAIKDARKPVVKKQEEDSLNSSSTGVRE